MVCPRCGSPVSEGATFCPKCGAAMPVGGRQPNYMPNGGGRGNNGGNNKSIIIIIIAVVVVLVFIIASISAFLLMDNALSKEEATPSPSSAPTAMPTPTQPPVPTAQIIYVPQDNGGGSEKTPKAQIREEYQPSAGGYRTFYSDKYDFACDYPSHFTVYDDHGTLTLHTVQSPDGTGVEKIVATPNSGETVTSSFREYVSSHPGEITYQSSGDTYYAVNILSGGTEYYKYCKFANGNLYWFEFIYPHAQHDLYDIYINDVYASFSY